MTTGIPKKRIFQWMLPVCVGVLLLPSCKDSSTGPGETEPDMQPRITQSVSIQDYTNINHSASLRNVGEASLDVYRNGEKIGDLSKKISSSTYNNSLNENLIGNYMFVLSGGGVSDTAKVEIPDYATIIETSGLEESLSFNEEGETNINLRDRVYDPNVEHEAKLKEVNSLDGRTDVSAENYDVHIKGKQNEFGNYSIEVVAGSNENENIRETLDGTLYELIRVDGQLLSLDGRKPVPGEFRVYNNEDSTLVEKLNIGTSGQFSKKLDVSANDLPEGYIISAREKRNGQDRSFVRSQWVQPAESKNGLELVTYPYSFFTDAGVSIQDGRRHVAELYTPDSSKDDVENWQTHSPTIRMWNWGRDPNADHDLDEIIISKSKDPFKEDDKDHDRFYTQEQAEEIRDKILDKNNVGVYLCQETPVRIVESYFTGNESEEERREKRIGKIIAHPSTRTTGSSLDFSEDGYLDAGHVFTSSPHNNTWGHELGGHVLQGWIGHSTLPKTKTVMPYKGADDHSEAWKPLDKNVAKISCEPTYIHGNGTGEEFTYLNRERDGGGWMTVNDIWSLKWLDEREN